VVEIYETFIKFSFYPFQYYACTFEFVWTIFGKEIAKKKDEKEKVITIFLHFYLLFMTKKKKS